MRIIARSTLYAFVESLENRREKILVKRALDAWFHEVQRAGFRNSADVKAAHRSASIVDAERTVIKGNDYRLVTAIDYKRQIVFIKWLGRHEEYDNIDVRAVKYGDQTYQKRKASRPSAEGN